MEMRKQKNNSIILVEDLHHTFPGGTTALRGINFSAGPGEFILCVGRNGSGKSVFMRHLNALYLPTRGRVCIDGVDTQKDRVFARRTVGMVFQNADSQIVGQTVYGDARFGPENLKLPPAEIEIRTLSALRIMDLEPLKDHRPHQLSGGEKKRLSLAGILAMSPHVLVLDEPFSSLDYPGVRTLLRHIVDLHRQGHTILLVTHDVEKAAAHADRIIVFEEGRIVEDGEPSTVIRTLGRYGLLPPDPLEGEVESPPWLK